MRDISTPNYSEKQLKRQVAEYETLPWYKSYRKLSAIIVLATLSWHQLAIGLIAVPLVYFMFKGKKVALAIGQVALLIALLIEFAYYTELNRNVEGVFIGSGKIILLEVVIYAFCARLLWLAYKVEKMRRIGDSPQ